ncbi:MAG: tail fiber domain-containing protein [Sulfuricaulis sp.]|nr:tail fiber domain-containing protein [Sulfuricaulis sp.]
MLSLDTVNKSLEIKLGGAVATTELPFVASYVDISQTTWGQSAAPAQDGVTTGATAVEVVAAPAASTTRKLNYLSVVNVDTAAVVLTVQVNNAATKRITWTGTLAVGDQLSFTDAGGWVVFDASGNRKTAMGGVLPAANFPALLGDVTTTAGSLTTAIGANKVTLAMMAQVATASVLGRNTAGTGNVEVLTTLPTAVQDNITRLGTVTSGVWNAGAVTSSGAIISTGNGVTHKLGTGGTGTNYTIFTLNGSSAATYGAALSIEHNSVSVGGFGTDAIVRGGAGVMISLVAKDANGLNIMATDASGTIRFYAGGTALRARINANGTQTWAPYGAGTATFDASGNITSVSDRRFKDRIRPLPYGLAEVLKLKAIQHGYNKRSGLERKHLYGGFAAQDVLKAGMPLAVGRDQRGYLTLADRPILGATVNAIHELAARVARLERKAA